MMSRDRLYLWLFFLVPLMYFLSLPIHTGDLAIWVAQGRYLLKSHSILRHDIYSVLPTTDLVYPVLSSFIYGVADALGGLIAASLVHKIALLALLALWYRSSLKGIDHPWSASTLNVLLLSWFGAASLCVDRPAMLAAVPFLIGFLILNGNDELTPKDLVTLNLINVVWVNLHGSWLLLLAMFLWREGTGKSYKTLFWGGASLLLTSLANPFGFKVFPYVLDTVRISQARRLDEWQPISLSPSSHYFSQEIAFLLLIGLTLFFAWKWFRSDRAKLMTLAGSPFTLLMILGFQSIRNTTWPFIALIPMASRLGLIRESKARSEARNFSNAVLALCVLIMTISFFPTIKPFFRELLPAEKSATFAEDAPFVIADFLNHTSDRRAVFNDWEYGSFLAYAQSHPIFMDTRNVIYSRSDFEKYEGVVSGSGSWQKTLQESDVGYIILNAGLRPRRISALQQSGNWREVMRDRGAVLMTATASETSKR